MTNEARTTLLMLGAAAAFGIFAALVVWYLERYERDMLHAEVRMYLERNDEFRAWLASREGGTA